MSYSSNKLEEVKKIKNGKGIQNILNEAYNILGNPMIMFNTEYSLLAYTDDTGDDDPISNEIIAYGTFSYERQKFFMEEGFGDAVANAKTVAYLTSERIKYDRISGKLFNKSKIHVANLVIAECNRPFEEGDVEAFEAVCELLSQEIIKSEFYQTYGMMYQETYIRKLIDGSIKEKGIYTAHISILYNGLKSNLYLAVADISKGCESGTFKICYFRDLFKKTQPTFKYSIYENFIIIIISTDSALNIKKDLGKLLNLFDENDMHVGISSRFENLFELRKYYLEAVDALKCGLDSNSGKRIFLYGGNV